MENSEIKENYQKELRRLWIRKNLKGYLLALPLLLLMAGFMFAALASSIIDSKEEVIGTVTGRGAWDTEYGNKPFMTATLENGTNVRVYFRDNILVRKGHKAVLIAGKAKYFGRTKYSFKEYVED